MSSKIRVGLSKTGLVLSTATHLCSFKSYYSSTIVGLFLVLRMLFTCEKSFKHEEMAFYMGAEMGWVWFGMHYFETVNVCW